ADTDFDVFFVQQPHDDRLAVIGRDNADANIKIFPAHDDLDTTVLGSTLLGDADVAHDFETCPNGTQQPPRRAVAFHQHAVDSVTDPDPIFEWFNVDVAGTQIDRFGEDQVHQPDNGGIAVGIIQRGRRLQVRRFDAGVGKFLEHRD